MPLDKSWIGRKGGRARIVPADQGKAGDAEFMLLRDGRIYFEGNLGDLHVSKDPYIRRFLAI